MTSLPPHSLALPRAPGNALAGAVRPTLQRRRGAPALANERKTGLFAWLARAERAAARRREAAWRARYDLGLLYGRSSVLHYAENLALLAGLERLCGARLPLGDATSVRAVDVGCATFHYATALQRFLARHGAAASRRVTLLGVEVDGHGVYRDGCSRADQACAHAALAGDGVHFAVADFTRMALPEQDVVTLLFPCLQSQLPLPGLPGLFKPRRLVRAAVQALRPGGLLIVANQTGSEFARLAALLGELPVRMLARAPLPSGLVPYRDRTHERVGSLWLRG